MIKQDATIEKTVRKCLVKAQEILSNQVTKITDATRPIGDFEQFDSLSAIEVTVMLEELLGCELGQNIFVSEDGRCALTFREVVRKCESICGGQVQ